MCSHCGPFAASWKEISKDAVFVEGTIGTTDICQGQLGEENVLNDCSLTGFASDSHIQKLNSVCVQQTPTLPGGLSPTTSIFTTLFWFVLFSLGAICNEQHNDVL